MFRMAGCAPDGGNFLLCFDCGTLGPFMLNWKMVHQCLHHAVMCVEPGRI